MQPTKLLLPVIIPCAICISAVVAIVPDGTPLMQIHDAMAGHYERGGLFFNKGYYPEAISEYKKALERNPKDVDANFELGVIHMNQKDYRPAAVQFRKLLVLRPGNKMAAGYAEYCERMEKQGGRKAQGADN